MTIRDALLDAWALLSPVECAGCAAADRSLCAGCAAALVPDAVTISAVGDTRVASALRYELRVRRVILAFKEHDRTDVARALAVPLAHAVHAAVAEAPRGGGIELALVPTSRAAYRRRGYDPVSLLVHRAGGRPARVLFAARAKGTQKTLRLEQRTENLRGAFVAARRLDGRRFVIVDDILTSGATISEAARAITVAGGEVVGAATMAFTPRLFPFRDIASGEDYRGAKGAQ